MQNDESLSGTITDDDYVAAQRLHLRRWRKRQRITLGIFALLGIMVMVIGPFVLGAIMFGAGAGGFFGELLLYKRSWPRAWRKLFAQQKNLHESFRYTWDKTGIHVSTPLTHALRPWSYFMRRLEDEEVLLLYHSDAMFELIPKRWLEDARLPDSLEALLLQHVGSSHATHPPASIAAEHRPS
jgi:hypothetical protein